MLPHPAIFSDVMPTITPWHVGESIGGGLGASNVLFTGAASAAWPAASVAIFVPFLLPRRISVNAMFVSNGASASDSVDAGIYTADGRRLGSIGLQGRAGTNVVQVFSLTATTEFGPGKFYMAMALNGTTGSVVRGSLAAELGRGLGLMQQDLSGESVPGTLPATATMAAMAQAYVPVFGIRRTGFTI